ncbi:MAG: 4-(cytidine 5'-diphospho)-2-C-methyl-D-erythritol kinase [Arcticibacter sp.]
MICFPNAKINLGLRVLRKRTDGYHDIESVFYPVPLCDVLEVDLLQPNFNGACFLEMTGSKRLFYSYSGALVVDDPENELTAKTIRAYDKAFGISTDVFIHLHKQIPSGAGLGGGSSDASFALRAINTLEGDKVDIASLMNLAASIGSDCPFFILNEPCLAEGKGGILNPIPNSLSGYHMVLVKPAFGVSTAEAYSRVVPKHDPNEPNLIDVINMPLESWSGSLVNDFEKGVFELYPQLAEIKKSLYDAGALYASMSGSGSTIFGLFKNEPILNDLFQDCFIFKSKL